MAHLAQHDFLTGLPNRLLLTERFPTRSGWPSGISKQVGLLFLDLDNFKHINDSLGHAIGDQLLQSVANGAWWRVCAPPTRYAARAATSS
jgi:diguanylate cyclase (GGDEF)-like protein